MTNGKEPDWCRAPTDCLQYHTGPSGNIQSFNFPSGQLLSSQAYRICFRQERDYCSITFTASLSTSPDPFQLLTRCFPRNSSHFT